MGLLGVPIHQQHAGLRPAPPCSPRGRRAVAFSAITMWRPVLAQPAGRRRRGRRCRPPPATIRSGCSAGRWNDCNCARDPAAIESMLPMTGRPADVIANIADREHVAQARPRIVVAHGDLLEHHVAFEFSTSWDSAHWRAAPSNPGRRARSVVVEHAARSSRCAPWQ